MKLDVSEIARTVGMRYRYEIDEPAIVDDTIVCAEPIKGRIEFANTGMALILKGQFGTAIRLECSRCLDAFAIPLSSEIDEQFELRPVTEDVDEDAETEAVIEDDIEHVFSGNVLDLTELIRQNLILAAPIRPLCREECKGLCPTCGQNLNDRECDCEKGGESTPLAKLKEMLEEKTTDD